MTVELATVNLEALLLLLKPPGSCPMIGEESGKFFSDGISKLVSPYGSVRYVIAINSHIVAALQLMVSNQFCIATNAYTDPLHQRRGYATALADRASKDFPSLQFSNERSRDGEMWVKSLSAEVPTLYHGTRSEFLEFKPSRGGEYGSGIYLTNDVHAAWKYAERAAGDGEEKVLIVMADIQNPFFATERDKARAHGVKKLRSMGYDGIIGASQTGERQYIAFHPKQIKVIDVVTSNSREKPVIDRP